MTHLKAPALRRGNGSIPADRVRFDMDGVVADIMTTFLDLARSLCEDKGEGGQGSTSS